MNIKKIIREELEDWPQEWVDDTETTLVGRAIEFNPPLSLSEFKEKVVPKLILLGHDEMATQGIKILDFDYHSNDVKYIFFYPNDTTNNPPIVDGGMGFSQDRESDFWVKYGWDRSYLNGYEIFDLEK